MPLRQLDAILRINKNQSLRQGCSFVPVPKIALQDEAIFPLIEAAEKAAKDRERDRQAVQGLYDELADLDEQVSACEAAYDEHYIAVTGATVSQRGWIAMRATAVGDDTTLANIIRLVDEATSSKAPIERMADRIAGVFVPAVIGIAAVTFIAWIALFAPGNFSVAFNHVQLYL